MIGSAPQADLKKQPDSPLWIIRVNGHCGVLYTTMITHGCQNQCYGDGDESSAEQNDTDQPEVLR